MPGDIADFSSRVATTPDEHELVRRQMAEANRLASLAPGEWRLWIDKSAEQLGTPRATLEDLVTSIIKDREKKAHEAKAEERRQEARIEKKREREQDRQQRERQRQQDLINKEAERKALIKDKAFARIIELPRDHHERKLAQLARQIGQDEATLQQEFAAFRDSDSETRTSSHPATWHVDPWADPVSTGALVTELVKQLRRYIVFRRSHEALVVALWIMMSWIHEHVVHSPYLVATSAEPDCGKTTVLDCTGLLVPRPLIGAEPTGASIYRVIDAEKPTLILDDADDLFQRKTDVKTIFNIAWTRGTKIPRVVNGRTYWFDPFSPKAVGLIGLKMPRPLSGRCIVIKLWPKKADETVEDFAHADDDQFAALRSKLCRWAADNATAIAGVTPLWPPGLINRVRANWRFLLAIAEHAGGRFPDQARAAAERVSRSVRKPSIGIQTLAAMRTMFATRLEIPSQQVVEELAADPHGPWAEYNRGGPITQRQLAVILDAYDIDPVAIHPTRRSTLTLQGYKREQFADLFPRFLPADPHIRTQRRPKPKKKKNG